MRKFLSNLIFGFTVAITWLTPLTSRGADEFIECLSASVKEKVEFISDQLGLKTNKDLYRKRFVKGDPSRPMSFGLEIEANMRDNANVVIDYRIPTIEEADWIKLPKEEQIRLAREFEKERTMKDEYWRSAALVRMSTADPRLPKELSFEGNGNFEFKGFVFSSLGEMADVVGTLFERYGAGSVQGHVAYPTQPMKGLAGYTISQADLAQFQTFERNYARHLEDNSVLPGKNLTHHSLGPLGEANRQAFIAFEEGAAELKSISNPWTHRMHNGPAPRSNGYPKGMSGFELRQFHKRWVEMMESLGDLANRLEYRGDLSEYSKFDTQKLISADSPFEAAKRLKMRFSPEEEKAYRKYYKDVGHEFSHEFKSLGFIYGGTSVDSRFFFPLRDWENHPLVLELPETERLAVQARIREATKEFLKETRKIAKKGKVNDASMRDLQIANAKWGAKVQLSQYFEKLNDSTRPRPNVDGNPDRALPQILTVPSSVRELPSGKKIRQYILDQDQLENNPAYEDFLENTVEVVYTTAAPPWGHVNLRVGKKFYGLQGVEWTTIVDYAPRTRDMKTGEPKPGKRGYAWRVPKERIAAVQEQIKKMYESSKDSNMPPFDGDSGFLEIEKTPDGKMKFKSPSINYPNNEAFDAKVVWSSGYAYLEAPNGTRFPLYVRPGGKLYLQSISCSTSATYVLQRYFGIEIPFFPSASAKGMRDLLERGNTSGTPPDVFLRYGPEALLP